MNEFARQMRAEDIRGMNAKAVKLLNAALTLPEGVRREVALRILESVTSCDAGIVEATSFAAELDQRVEDYECGEATADSWDIVRERIRLRLSQNA